MDNYDKSVAKIFDDVTIDSDMGMRVSLKEDLAAWGRSLVADRDRRIADLESVLAKKDDFIRHARCQGERGMLLKYLQQALSLTPASASRDAEAVRKVVEAQTYGEWSKAKQELSAIRGKEARP